MAKHRKSKKNSLKVQFNRWFSPQIGLILGMILFFFLATAFIASSFLFQKKYTVILTTFGEKDKKGNWQGEVAPYMKKLINQKVLSNDVPVCEAIYEGTIYGQPVLVVISGLGKIQMTTCVTNLLTKKASQIQEVILSGIAGITPIKGGAIDENWYTRTDKPVMLGDVCINSAAFDYDNQFYTADQGNTTVPDPVFWVDPASNDIHGIKGNTALADQLANAAKRVDWPTPNRKIQQINTAYHGTNRKPTFWGPKYCLESSGDLFWHDIRSDMHARDMGATWLNKTLGLEITANDIIVATAMEGMSAGQVIESWNSAYNTHIAYAYIRGASNFDHSSLDSMAVPLMYGKMSEESRENDSGIEFASNTASLPVLEMLKLRSEKK